MRIALLTSYPRDHTTFVGGVQTATAALIEGLERAGAADLHVVTSADVRADEREQRGGVTFHFLAAPRRRPRFPGRLASARRALKSIDPDVVHCQDTLVLAPAALGGRWAKVFSIHGVKRAEARLRTGWERPSAWFEAALERFVHGRYDAIVCNSAYAARAAGPRARTFEVPNAVSSEFFEVRRAAEPEPHVLFAGALAPLKAPHDLVSAHAALRADHPALRTSFCGPEEDAGYVEGMRAAAAPGVTWEGLVARPRLLEMLATAATLVLPSRQENVPMVLAEAMAAGVPVVATRVGGIPEMVDDGSTGLLFEPGDAGALTAHLRTLLEDPARARGIGAAAAATARTRWSPEAVGARTLAVYEEVTR